MNWLLAFTLNGTIAITGPYDIDTCCRQMEYVKYADAVCVAAERPSQKVYKTEMSSHPRCFGVEYYNPERLSKQKKELEEKDRKALSNLKQMGN